MLDAALTSVGLFDGGGAGTAGSLLEAIALRGGDEARALASLARTPSRIEEEIATLGRYSLLRKVACSPPELCFEAVYQERPLFVRTFPRSRLCDALIARLERWPGLDFGVVDHQPYVVSDYIPGIDLRVLRDLRPSLPSMLALLAEAIAALGAIHVDAVHGHLTPGRIRIEPMGSVRLCLGTSELREPPGEASAGEDLCTLARSMLEGAVDAREISAILASGDPEALIVAGDRLVELHPELDELIACVLGKAGSPESILPLLAAHVAPEEALSLIRRLVETSRSAPLT